MTVREQTGETVGAAVAKLSIPASVTSVSLAGIHLQDWVLLLTIVYTVLMIGEKLWKWWSAWAQKYDVGE